MLELFDFMDRHPLLILGAIVVAIVAYTIIKYFIDAKKGANSEERKKVLDILKKVVPTEEMYVPVYAYWNEPYGPGKSVKCWYYALGITEDKLYVVPLHIAGKEIGYDKTYVIAKERLGKVDCGKPGGSMHFIHLYDKNQKEVFRFVVEEKNTKLDRTYPVNIVQIEECRAFMEKLEQWIN